MSGRRSSSRATTRSSSSLASASPARSRSSMIAVAKRGSAKIITPAADWIRCAQVREPTTRKKASWILRCSQMMPVRPQNTSRWPRSRRTGRVAAADAAHARRLTAPAWRGRLRRRCCEPGGAQLEQELGGVDDVGGVGRQRQQHLLARVESAGEQRREIGRVQRQHEHAEHVLPEEGRREQVAAEDLLLPDRAGDHDRVEHQGLDHDRRGRGGEALAGGEVAQHQAEADQEDQELDRRQHALHQRPGRGVAPPALLGGVEAAGLQPAGVAAAALAPP